MSRRILITGASIAGNTAAWWLGHHGFDVTVVERAPAFRDGGQNIDVRGAGRDVLRRMGLERAALDHGTGEEGTAWVDGHGRAVATFGMDGSLSAGPTAEMEILRGDLARLLHGSAQKRAKFRFGDSVTRIEEGPDAVSVTFTNSGAQGYDAVLVAEGVGSTTREIVFPGENDPRWMDMAIAYFTIPRVSDDDRIWRWYNATGGRSIHLRPDMHGTTRAMLTARQPPGGEQDWAVDRQKAFLREHFHDAGWQASRVLAGMEITGDFYLDVLRQVRMKRWSSGRVVLTGDAVWCVTPLAGIGTTLSITGAYVLAGELARNADVSAAFAAYERVMRPMVKEGQGIPKIAPRLMNPSSRLGIHLLHGALRVASRPGIRRVASKLFAGRSKEPDLACYDTPVSA